jgi:hypothetical protein
MKSVAPSKRRTREATLPTITDNQLESSNTQNLQQIKQGQEKVKAVERASNSPTRSNKHSSSIIQFTTRNPQWTYFKLQLYVQSSHSRGKNMK